MTTTPQPHVHADKIIQYVQDMTQTVWERVPGDPPEDVVDEDLACWEHDGDDE